jgi:hypothetical protein
MLGKPVDRYDWSGWHGWLFPDEIAGRTTHRNRRVRVNGSVYYHALTANRRLPPPVAGQRLA